METKTILRGKGFIRKVFTRTYANSPDIRKQRKEEILANPTNMKVVTSLDKQHPGNNLNNKFTGQADDIMLNLKNLKYSH